VKITIVTKKKEKKKKQPCRCICGSSSKLFIDVKAFFAFEYTQVNFHQPFRRANSPCPFFQMRYPRLFKKITLTSEKEILNEQAKARNAFILNKVTRKE